jgi:hypothetical protein
MFFRVLVLILALALKATGPDMTSIYTLTIFTSAFLLFLVQPMITKLLLPFLGGSPAVWNTAMMFFQIVLLLGYSYAHLGGKWLNSRMQTRLHLFVLLLSIIFVPLAIHTELGFGSVERPIFWVLFALTLSIGFPFFVLSSTSSLLQSWLSRTTHKDAQNPYFLYSASNIGSLLALAAYPLLLEPMFKLSQQLMIWSMLYFAFLALMAACALLLRHYLRPDLQDGARTPAELAAPVPLRRRAYWVLLAFIPSSLLLGVTSYITTDIASLPLLWILPLAIYLLTFILAFARKPKMIDRALNAQVGLVPLTALAIAFEFNYLTPVLILHLFTFFAVAMGCHGMLSRDRPEAAQLTAFFFCLSLGGMLGGIFNALLAPVMFTNPVEYPLILALAMFMRPSSLPESFASRRNDIVVGALFFAALALMFTLCEQLFGPHHDLVESFNAWTKAHIHGFSLTLRPLLSCIFFVAVMCYLYRVHTRTLRFALSISALLVSVPLLNAAPDSSALAGVIFAERNFFGVNRVIDAKHSEAYVLMHGTTLHGMQSKKPEFKMHPTTYYGPLKEVFDALNETVESLPIATIGMGAGTLACFGKKDQEMDFFEIDPAVVRIAENPDYFTYYSDCPPKTNVALGDGRLELSKAPDGKYGIVIIDAFSSDAVPMHLITREALQIYLSKLAPGGILAFNISNRHLDLAPVMASLAKDAHLVAFLRRNMKPEGVLAQPSIWVVMTRDIGDFQEDSWPTEGWHVLEASPGMRVWTDNYSNILQTLF